MISTWGMCSRQAVREVKAAPDARSQLIAAGLGYVDFALQRPALFRLLWGAARPDFTAAHLSVAALAAYRHLADQVGAAGGKTVNNESAVWAIAHGLADLLSAGRMRSIGSFPPAERDAAITAIISRTLPAPA